MLISRIKRYAMRMVYQEGAPGTPPAAPAPAAPAPAPAAPAPAPTPAPAAPSFTAEQIAWMMANGFGGQQQTPAPAAPAAPQKSAYEIQREKLQEEQNNAQQREEMRRQVVFENEFDGVLDKHKALFSMDSKAIRAAADGLKDGALCKQLQAVAAKAFFDSEKNLMMLTPGEQELVKASIIGKHESQIDSQGAWDLVKRAIFTADLISRNNDARGTGGAAGDMLANVDAFIKKAIGKFKRT